MSLYSSTRVEATNGTIVQDTTGTLLTTNINPSGVHNLPHLNSPTTILSTPENSLVPENSSNNSNQNSDEEFLNIAGRSIFDHEKVH